MTEKTVSQAQFAAMEQVTRQAVARWVKAGLPIVGGQIPVREAKAWLATNVSRRSGKVSGEGRGLLAARTRKEAALAGKHELELRVIEGELLSRGEVQAAWCGMITRAREVLLQVPAQIADKLAAESDPIRCGEIIEAEIHRALVELAEYPAKKPAARGQKR